MNNSTCTIEECAKAVRSKHSPYCNMHYFRIYRGGSAGSAVPRKRAARSPHCEVGDCTKPDASRGLCSMHEARERRHGDVNTVITPADRYYPSGPDHQFWAGQDVGYSGAHTRVGRVRGLASRLDCIDCGGQAAHWSYDHEDPNELHTDSWSANTVSYSANPEHYYPRCVPCHKAFDITRADAMAVS